MANIDGDSLAEELFPGVLAVDVGETPAEVRRWLSDQLDAQLDAEAQIVEILANVEIARRLRYWVNRGHDERNN